MKKTLAIIFTACMLTGIYAQTAKAETMINGQKLALTQSQVETIQQRRQARYNELKKQHEQNKENLQNEVSFWKKLFNDDSAKTEAQKKQEAANEAIKKETGKYPVSFILF